MALAVAPVPSAPVRSARRASAKTQARLGESVRKHRQRVTGAAEDRVSRQIASQYFGSIETQLKRAFVGIRPQTQWAGAAVGLKETEFTIDGEPIPPGGPSVVEGFFENVVSGVTGDIVRLFVEPDDYDVDGIVDWKKAERDLGRIVGRNAVAIDNEVGQMVIDLLRVEGTGLGDAAAPAAAVSGVSGAVVADFQLGGGLDVQTLNDIGERVTRINAETRDRLFKTTSRGLAEGWSPHQLAKALIQQVGTWRGKDGTIKHSRAMVIARTETGIVYNRSSVLRSAQTGLVDSMICLDNPDCGWIGHDSGDKRNGKAVTFEDALAHPLSHPNCVRAYAPNVEGLGVPEPIEFIPDADDPREIIKKATGHGDHDFDAFNAEQLDDIATAIRQVQDATDMDLASFIGSIRARKDVPGSATPVFNPRTGKRDLHIDPAKFERDRISKLTTHVGEPGSAAALLRHEIGHAWVETLSPAQDKRLGEIRSEHVFTAPLWGHTVSRRSQDSYLEWTAEVFAKMTQPGYKGDLPFDAELRGLLKIKLAPPPAPVVDAPDPAAIRELYKDNVDAVARGDIDEFIITRDGRLLATNKAFSNITEDDYRGAWVVRRSTPGAKLKVVDLLQDKHRGVAYLDLVTPGRVQPSVTRLTFDPDVQLDANTAGRIGGGLTRNKLNDLSAGRITDAEYTDYIKNQLEQDIVGELIRQKYFTFEVGAVSQTLTPTGYLLTAPPVRGKSELDQIVEQHIDDINRYLQGNGPLPPTMGKQGVGLREQQKFDYDRLAKDQGLTIEQLFLEIEARLQTYVDQLPLTTRRTFNGAEKILAAGRFKSQFEVPQSGGFYGPDSRAKAEGDMFGYDHDIANLDKTTRPIYGYMDESAAGGRDSADSYGEVKFVMKPEVRLRTTVVWGDSLYHSATPSPLVGVRASSWSGRYMPKANQDGSPYIEAQIHGGVSVDDVAEIRFAFTQPTDSMKVMLRGYGFEEGRFGIWTRTGAPAVSPAAARAKLQEDAAVADDRLDRAEADRERFREEIERKRARGEDTAISETLRDEAQARMDTAIADRERALKLIRELDRALFREEVDRAAVRGGPELEEAARKFAEAFDNLDDVRNAIAREAGTFDAASNARHAALIKRLLDLEPPRQRAERELLQAASIAEIEVAAKKLADLSNESEIRALLAAAKGNRLLERIYQARLDVLVPPETPRQKAERELAEATTAAEQDEAARRLAETFEDLRELDAEIAKREAERTTALGLSRRAALYVRRDVLIEALPPRDRAVRRVNDELERLKVARAKAQEADELVDITEFEYDEAVNSGTHEELVRAAKARDEARTARDNAARAVADAEAAVARAAVPFAELATVEELRALIASTETLEQLRAVYRRRLRELVPPTPEELRSDLDQALLELDAAEAEVRAASGPGVGDPRLARALERRLVAEEAKLAARIALREATPLPAKPTKLQKAERHADEIRDAYQTERLKQQRLSEQIRKTGSVTDPDRRRALIQERIASEEIADKLQGRLKTAARNVAKAYTDMADVDGKIVELDAKTALGKADGFDYLLRDAYKDRFAELKRALPFKERVEFGKDDIKVVGVADRATELRYERAAAAARDVGFTMGEPIEAALPGATVRWTGATRVEYSTDTSFAAYTHFTGDYIAYHSDTMERFRSGRYSDADMRKITLHEMLHTVSDYKIGTPGGGTGRGYGDFPGWEEGVVELMTGELERKFFPGEARRGYTTYAEYTRPLEYLFSRSAVGDESLFDWLEKLLQMNVKDREKFITDRLKRKGLPLDGEIGRSLAALRASKRRKT